jgi:hypothetical protein
MKDHINIPIRDSNGKPVKMVVMWKLPETQEEFLQRLETTAVTYVDTRSLKGKVKHFWLSKVKKKPVITDKDM